jgi:hypothetical protein
MKPECQNCRGFNWVCENHDDEPWDDIEGCQCGAGMPCPVCNDAKPPDYPRDMPGIIMTDWLIPKAH